MREADWKRLRALHQVALNRFCTRVLEESSAVISSDELSAHERYLTVYRTLRKRDEELATAFDDLRRSRAIQRLAAMINLKVVTEEELQQFSDEMRESAEGLARIHRGELW